MAMGKLLALWSAVLNGEWPQTWQTELTLQVTCWVRQMRTKPPQIMPEMKPCQE